MSFWNKPNVFSHITHNTKLSRINSSLVAVQEQRKSISMIIPCLEQEECLNPLSSRVVLRLGKRFSTATSGLSDADQAELRPNYSVSLNSKYCHLFTMSKDLIESLSSITLQQIQVL
ncbi:hypothetical protein WA026_008703 [Henosepilachna vigintioctopunctata]|uniref:Uncharacterized protein n=1 Tax=Henosepilachna vigintioctopunctata TaxID=420089 RepID=A0AAW1V2H3_9CUCU